MTDKKSILLALTDKEEIGVFTAFLAKLGYSVKSAMDGAHALESAIQSSPSMIIADPDLPVIGAEKLFQILRHNPHTSKIPFLFISDNASDIKGFKTGVDIFIVRPINLDEFYARVKRTLAGRQGAGVDDKEIEGTITHMSVADILQFLNLNNKEGELRITRGLSTGNVYLKDGQVYNAVLDGVEKEKALFRLLGWTEGRFEFIPRHISITKKIRSTTGSLLMEGMRQIDELKKHRSEFPTRGQTVRAKVDPGAAAKGLKPIVCELLTLAGEHPVIEDLVDHSTFTDYEAYNAIGTMISKGMLEVADPAASDSTAPADEFLTREQAVSIREKILSRFADVVSLNYAKIYVVSSSGRHVAEFMERVSGLRGFKLTGKHFSAPGAGGPVGTGATPFGEVATYRLYGGLDLVLFSIPTVHAMGPLWRSFASNLVGLVVIWDERSSAEMKELAVAKKDIMNRARVPAAYVYAGGAPQTGDMDYFKKTLGIGPDEPVFIFDKSGRNTVSEVFYSLFGRLLSEEFVAI